MTSYQLLQNINWDKLPTLDYRQDFFIKIYAEKLNLSNPFFIQARLGTVFSCANEIKLYINSYEYTKNSNYIINGIDELIEIVDQDEIIIEFLKDDWGYFKESLANIKQKLNNENKFILKNILNFILSLRDSYEKLLLENLKQSIFSASDLKQKNRILKNIEKQVSSYISFQLDNGFSNVYLFNRLQHFTRLNNYGDKNFEQKFDSIFDKISNERLNFKIYFLISDLKNFRDIRNEIEQREDVKIYENVTDLITKIYADKILKKKDSDKYLEVSVESSDYMAASFTARKILDKLLDIVFYTAKVSFKLSDICIVKTLKDLTPTHEVSILEMSKKTYVEKSLYSARYPFLKFNEIIENLDTIDSSQLVQSLRYVRLTRNINSNEQKILNLWIALESLFSWKGDEAILTILLKYVPKIYAEVALICRLDLALYIIRKCNNKIIEDKFNRSLGYKDVLDIFSDQKLAKKVYESLNDDLLIYRWCSLNDIFKDKKNIKKQVEKTELDVCRQIRRMYFLRNKITHTGFYTDINPILTLHLMDYIQVCYVAINEALKESLQREKRKYSFEELFAVLTIKHNKIFYENNDAELLNINRLFLL